MAYSRNDSGQQAYGYHQTYGDSDHADVNEDYQNPHVDDGRFHSGATVPMVPVERGRVSEERDGWLELPEDKQGLAKYCAPVAAICHWLTEGPQEDRRLKRTVKDDEFVQELCAELQSGQEDGTGLDVNHEARRVVKCRPDYVLMMLAYGKNTVEMIEMYELDKYIFDKIDKDHNGRLTRQELLNGLTEDSGTEDSVHEFVCSRTTYLRLLSNRVLVNKLWDMFCVTEHSDGEVLRADFPAFVLLLLRKTLTCLEAAAHMKCRAFWGYGCVDSGPTPHLSMIPGCHDNRNIHHDEHRETEEDEIPPEWTCCCGLITLPRGWAEDLWYYLCQNHALLRLVFSDIDHPLSSRECVMIEVVMWGYTFLMAILHQKFASHYVPACMNTDNGTQILCDDSGVLWESGWGGFFLIMQPLGGPYSLFYVTIPCMLLSWLLFTIHLVPCVYGEGLEEPGTLDVSVEGRDNTSKAKAHVRRHMTLVGRAAGVFTLGLAVFLFLTGVVEWAEWDVPFGAVLERCLAYRGMTYLWQILWIILVPFCPWAAAASEVPGPYVLAVATPYQPMDKYTDIGDAHFDKGDQVQVVGFDMSIRPRRANILLPNQGPKDKNWIPIEFPDENSRWFTAAMPAPRKWCVLWLGQWYKEKVHFDMAESAARAEGAMEAEINADGQYGAV